MKGSHNVEQLSVGIVPLQLTVNQQFEGAS